MILKSGTAILNLQRPLVMGIVNLTPDSFYSGSQLNDTDAVLRRVEEMMVEGMDILDIGAVSTRPGAKIPDISEEIQRLQKPLKAISDQFPNLWISLDTFRRDVIQLGIDSGVRIINDISMGTWDDPGTELVAAHGLAYILMHNRAKPEELNLHSNYDELVLDVLSELKTSLDLMTERGLDNIVIDPGFGFSKNASQNFKILKNLRHFQALDRPIMVGISRKSMIYKTLNIKPKDALNGSTALNMIALQNGASILRVHDVKEAKEAVKLFQEYQEA